MQNRTVRTGILATSLAAVLAALSPTPTHAGILTWDSDGGVFPGLVDGPSAVRRPPARAWIRGMSCSRTLRIDSATLPTLAGLVT